MLTQMTTSAILWGSGDLIAQRLERWERKQQRLRARQQQQSQQQQKRGGKKGAVPGPPPSSSAAADSSSSMDEDTTPWDLRRALLTGMFGATFVGPVGHFWYNAIDRCVCVSGVCLCTG